MLNSIHETRVRKGESTEALVFVSDFHPKSQVFAQNSCVFYMTPRTTLTLCAMNTQAQAEERSRIWAGIIFDSAKPYKIARELASQDGA